ncbi:hypothetical protein D0Z07_8582 [Hyphodiscus hymeniophilus]|uniref:Uncharacterized protein n=1 Tax=Hyphodiscus hymeniophilus TaxID=353542 RepID=A0A9P6SN74_9HELO|nr:hypothetical protein D0Z07_8582 [Hyphodiscus hymeniophilus]
MSSDEDEVYVTSRSRTPSVIHVISQTQQVFRKLPDLIQEAALSTEFSSPRLQISRVQNSRVIDSEFLSSPQFFVRSRTDSGVDLPDLTVTDEKVLEKFGSGLTANFADIRAYGAKAFFQKQNRSNNTTYSVCVCATGYIWVYVVPPAPVLDSDGFSRAEIQIGTFGLKARAITTTEIQCQHRRFSDDSAQDARQLSLLCATVLAKYLHLRMIGQQYEEATESAIKQSQDELWSLRVVNPSWFRDWNALLRFICTNAPMPPESNVSLISRSMITGRWQCWRDTSILRRRYLFPQRIIRCFRISRHDSLDLLSGCFNPTN